MVSGGTPSFGALLRRLRQDAGLTQEELAERAGLSVRGISDLERGVNRSARRETARLFADALGLRGEERRHFLEAARGRATAPSALGFVPVPPTPLIGRVRELSTMRELFAAPGVRLVTLIGPGGIGKTRLALEYAARVAADYRDGVWFVDLAPLADPALVSVAIAHAVGAGERAAITPLDTLAASLGAKQTLLVLDNFEHLLEAAPDVAHLLARCPQLQLLVTSRAPLRLRAEQVLVVPPLPLPEQDDASTLARMQANEAVTLFVQRAHAAHEDFALATENAAAVSEICRRLDGLPLAIELAAARVPLLSPAAIAARLDRRLALLSEGPRDLPPRHQTLRNAIAWSYQLLQPAEQRLFRALGVFAGGATLAAADWVGGRRTEVGGDRRQVEASSSRGVGHDAPPTSVLDSAATLAGWGLLRQEHWTSDEPRLTMLETIREYAVERLVELDEAGAAQHAHAAYFLALAEEAEPQLTGPRQADWLATLDGEQDNLRAALAWSLAAGDRDMSLRLAGALWWYWEIRGHFAEGQSWLERALESEQDGDVRGRAKALFGLGAIAYRRRDLPTSETCLRQALPLFRALDDPSGAASCLAFLGLGAMVRGRLDEAEAFHEEALRAARAAGDSVIITGTLSNLGEVAHARGDLARAAQFYEASLQAAEAMANPLVTARSLTNVATVSAEVGEVQRAAALHRDALRVYRDVGDRRGIASSLEGLAALAVIQSRAAEAARLYGCAAALRATFGSPVPVIEQGLYEHGITAARAVLGGAAYERLWATGFDEDLDEILAEVFETLGAADPARSSAQTTSDLPAPRR